MKILSNIRKWFGGAVKALVAIGAIVFAGQAEAKLVHEKSYTITDHWWSDGKLCEKQWEYVLHWDLFCTEPKLSNEQILQKGKGYPVIYNKPFELGIKINGVTPKTTGSYSTTDENNHTAKFQYTAATLYYSQATIERDGYTNGEIGFVDLNTEGAVWRISGKDYSGSVILFARKDCMIILEDGVEIGDNGESNFFSQVSPIICRADEVTIINEGNAKLWGNKYSPAVATIGGICNFISTGDTGWLYAFGGKNAPAIGLMEFHGSNFYDDGGMSVDDFFDLGFGQVSQDSAINFWGRVDACVFDNNDRGVCAIGIDSMEDYNTRGPLPLTVNICESAKVTAGGAPAIGIAEGRQGRFTLKVDGGSVSAENRTGHAAPAIGSGPNTSCDPASYCDVLIHGGNVFAGVYGTVSAPGIGMASETGVDAYISISGGKVEAAGGGGCGGIGNAWYDGISRKDVRITGGTVVTEGDLTVAWDSRIGIYCGYVTGGSVKVDRKVGKSLTDGSKNLVCITVEGLEAKAKVSSLSLPVGNRNYGTTDVYADGNGRIFLWVPAGDYSGKLVVNGVKYDADASEGDVVATREKRYTVKFNACGGSPTPASITRSPGRVIGPNVLNEPTLSGYVFDGWWTESMYGSRVSALTVVNQSMTCYAHWSKESTTHVEREVKFIVSSETYATLVGIEGTQLGPLPVPPERPGWTFDGWYTLGGDRITESTKFTAALTGYTRWTPLKETVNGYTWRYRVIDGKAEICTPQSDYERAIEPAPAAGSVVTVPSTLGGYPVTSIGEDAFFNCSNMTHVVIPDSVRKIGDRAFHGCTRLTEPEGMQNVESIGDEAFYGCKNLGTFTLPGGLKEIADFMFTDCYALQEIVIPEGVERIGACAFAFCKNLAVVTIPASVTDIGNEAFIGCENLWNLVMPDSPRRIGVRAFYKCDSLAISTGFVVVDGILYGYSSYDSSLTLPDGVKFLTGLVFLDQDTGSYKTVTELTIPESVVASFENSQFYKTGLQTVNLAFADGSHADMVARRDAIKAAIEASGYRSAVTYNLPEVTVTFDAGDSYVPQERSAQAGKALGSVVGTVPEPVRDGFKFLGWWTQPEGGERVTSATVVRGNDVYYAQWKMATGESFRATFGKNGGTGGDNYVTVTYDEAMPTPRTAPKLSGWTFAGYWDTLSTDEKGNAKGKQYYDGSMKSVRVWDKKDSATLWAKWTNKVTFGKNGGTGGDSYVTCTKGQPMPKRTMPTKTGYTFAGYWTTTGEGGVKYYNADGTSAHVWDKSGNVTLWAKWEKAVSVKVTFGKNGGTGGDNYVTCTTGKPMPTPRTAPKKSGWTFGGYWDTLACDAKGNPLGKQYYNAKMESVRNWDKTSAVTLWAKWTVRVTLGKNGGTGGDSYVTVIYNQPFPTRAMPTKSGYTFGGYFVSASSKTGQCYNADGTGTSTMKWTTGGTPTIWALWNKTGSNVVLPVAATTSAASTPVVAESAGPIPAGLYSGVLADGSGAFWLMLDEPEEGYDRTAYIYIASEDGALTAECTVEESDGILVLTTEDGETFAIDPAAGSATLL